MDIVDRAAIEIARLRKLLSECAPGRYINAANINGGDSVFAALQKLDQAHVRWVASEGLPPVELSEQGCAIVPQAGSPTPVTAQEG